MNESPFVRLYSQLLLTVWRDDRELARLRADPTAYVTALGFEVGPGSTVVLTGADAEQLPSRAEAERLWSGPAGRHTLVVPDQPLVNVAELSQDALDAVSGGWGGNGSNVQTITII